MAHALGFRTDVRTADGRRVDVETGMGVDDAHGGVAAAGGGENLPLDILRSLSVWVSVLDEREVVPGAVLGGMFGCLAAFEDSLSGAC